MLETTLARLQALADPERAAHNADYHKAPRVYLGVAVPLLTDLAKDLRSELNLDADVERRIALADGLWQTDIHEARLLAAKLLAQARIRPDEGVWRLIASWVPTFDAWAIADHACDAGQRRVVADPSRLDEVETWTGADHMWSRRAALVITLPWTKQNHPSPEDLATRDRVLGWAATYVDDRDWFIQKAVGWWLRELSKHDPDRTRAFIATYGERMKPFARKEALRHLR